MVGDQYQALKSLTEATQRVKELEDSLHDAHVLTMPRFYFNQLIEERLRWISYSVEKAKEQISK